MNPLYRSQFVENFTENYVEPVIYHPICQWAFRITLELVKIFAVKFFLDYLSGDISQGTSEEMTRKIYRAVIIAPLVEEIVFRGFVVVGIKAMQSMYNAGLLKCEPTEEDKRVQQIFRIHLSAFLFAAIHLNNLHKTVPRALIQFVEAYIAGLSLGYLSEKYQTLSATILSHGIHNALCIPIETLPSKHAHVFLLALVIYEIGVYILATTNIDVYLARHLIEHYAAANNCIPQQNQQEEPLAV